MSIWYFIPKFHNTKCSAQNRGGEFVKKQENVEISKTDWRQYTKLEYKYNLTKHGTRSLPDFKSNP